MWPYNVVIMFNTNRLKGNKKKSSTLSLSPCSDFIQFVSLRHGNSSTKHIKYSMTNLSLFGLEKSQSVRWGYLRVCQLNVVGVDTIYHGVILVCSCPHFLHRNLTPFEQEKKFLIHHEPMLIEILHFDTQNNALGKINEKAKYSTSAKNFKKNLFTKTKPRYRNMTNFKL